MSANCISSFGPNENGVLPMFQIDASQIVFMKTYLVL